MSIARSCLDLMRLVGLATGMALIIQRPIAAQHGSGLTQIQNDAGHIMPELKSMPLTVRPKSTTSTRATSPRASS